jgi:hypothetical protein
VHKNKLGVFVLLPCLFLFAAVSKQASAFPEMVRHGYTNCTSCHMSPNGGGILNPYGRTLSEQALSGWSQDGEGNFLWSAFKMPDWLNIGGDFRGMGMVNNTFAWEDVKAFPMQADMEGSVSVGRFDAVASVGYQAGQNVPDPSMTDNILSRRHYLTFHATDNIAIRAGKFYAAYGINMPDHSIWVRQLFGFDQDQETYNVEGSYIADKFDVFATAIFGRPYEPQLTIDSGAAVRASVTMAETYKVGLGYYYGTNPTETHHLAGPFAILGFSPKVFASVEWDFQRAFPVASNAQFGWVDYLRLNYEFYKGVIAYATQELQQLDASSLDSFQQRYGAGIDFFPRPHFEIQAFYQHTILAAGTGSGTDLAAVMLHFYP